MPQPVNESSKRARSAQPGAGAARARSRSPTRTGSEPLTIRSLAQHLGVKPMSLYYYVANKSEILDAIVDVVFSEIDLPTVDGDWRSEIRSPCHLGAAGPAAPLLGDRAAGVPHHARPGHPASPRRDARHPAGGRLLRGDDRPRLRPDRQLRVRVRAPGGRPALRRPGHRRRRRRADDGTVPRRASTPTSSNWRPSTSSSPATTSATSSTSGST